ncbi:MAG: pilin [Candidatus Andersenbacteria bacterium]
MNIKFLKYISVFLIAFSLVAGLGSAAFLSSSVVYAQNNNNAKKFGPVNCGDLGIQCDTDANETKVIAIIQKVINVFLSIIAIIAVGMLIYGGVLFLTSAGDETKTKQAKNLILYVVVGLIVIGLSAVIVNFTINAIR